MRLWLALAVLASTAMGLLSLTSNQAPQADLKTAVILPSILEAFFQDNTKCAIIDDVIHDHDALQPINKYMSYNGVYFSNFSDMTKEALGPYSSRVRKDVFCTVIIAEGGHQKNFSDRYKKLQMAAKSLKPKLLVLLMSEAFELEDLPKFDFKTIIVFEKYNHAKAFALCPTYNAIQAEKKLKLGDQASMVSDFKEMLTSMKSCPLPRKDKPVKVGIAGTNPFMYNDEKKRVLFDDEGIPLGSGGGIAKALRKLYNYTISIEVYSQQGPFNVTTKKWGGLIGDAIDGKLDLALADVVITKETIEATDASNFVSLAEVMTTVCYPKPKKALFNILRPFGPEMWLSVLASLIAVGLTFAAIYYTYIKIRHPIVIFGGRRRIEDFVQDSYASLIQGEPPPNFRNNKCTCSSACFMINLWGWAGMLLVFAYTCNLRPHLLYRATEDPIKTYQDILDRDMTVLMVNNSAGMFLLMTSPLEVHRKLVEQAEKKKGFYNYKNGIPTELLESVFDCRASLLNSRILVKFAPREVDKYGRKIRLIIREIEENLFERYSGALLEKFSPLTPYFNELLSRLRAGGLIQHYWSDPLYLEQTMSMDTFTFYDDSKDKLTLETFFLIFVFLAFGMVLALVTLLIEVLVHKRQTRKANNDVIEINKSKKKKKNQVQTMYPTETTRRRK